MKNLSKLASLLLISMLVNACVTKGDPGAPGVSGRVVRSIYCAGPVLGMHPDINGLHVEYNAIVTAVGDVFATANIIDDVGQTSGTSFYASAEADANAAAVNVTADYVGIANGGYWTVTLNRSTLITNILYDDPSLPSVLSMNFTPSACTVHAF